MSFEDSKMIMADTCIGNTCKTCGNIKFNVMKVKQIERITQMTNWHIAAFCTHCNSYIWGLDYGKAHDKMMATMLHNWAENVKARDGYACVLCASTDNVQAHHIKAKRYLLDIGKEMEIFNINNGITLCQQCHREAHESMLYAEALRDNVSNDKG